MAKLAILGHATRGKEIIKLLEMLGGKNDHHCCGGFINRIYFINENGYIESCDKMDHLSYFQLSLEEFLEKFPYKVGDKVKHAKINDIVGRITDARWENKECQVSYYVEWDDETKSCYFVKNLQPYKKETMEELKIDIPAGYEFAGVDDNAQQVVFAKIQPEYPKTYESCCMVLQDACMAHKGGYKGNLMQAFQKLLICRDAYWQITGEQMGLGKPWEPDWSNPSERKYCIVNTEGNITKWVQKTTNKILAFPTEEIQDAFYENFKELINQCKELL